MEVWMLGRGSLWGLRRMRIIASRMSRQESCWRSLRRREAKDRPFMDESFLALVAAYGRQMRGILGGEVEDMGGVAGRRE